MIVKTGKPGVGIAEVEFSPNEPGSPFGDNLAHQVSCICHQQNVRVIRLSTVRQWLALRAIGDDVGVGLFFRKSARMEFREYIAWQFGDNLTPALPPIRLLSVTNLDNLEPADIAPQIFEVVDISGDLIEMELI